MASNIIMVKNHSYSEKWIKKRGIISRARLKKGEERRKEMFYLTLFLIRLNGVGHMVKNHSYSEKWIKKRGVILCARLKKGEGRRNERRKCFI